MSETWGYRPRILQHTNKHPTVFPTKHDNHFDCLSSPCSRFNVKGRPRPRNRWHCLRWNYLSANTTTVNTILSILSRQTYLETTGSSFLYRFVHFNFNSPYLMNNYVSAINENHLHNIQAVTLLISMREPTSLPKRMFQNLASLVSLRTLNIRIEVARLPLYRGQLGHRQPPIPDDILAGWAARPWSWLRVSDSLTLSVSFMFHMPSFGGRILWDKSQHYGEYDWGNEERGWECFAKEVKWSIGEDCAKVEVVDSHWK